MLESGLFDKIANKEIDKELIAMEVIENPELIPDLFEGLQQKADIKFGSDKVLRIISDLEPRLLYPFHDVFVENLDHKNKILRWGASKILANLTPVDDDQLFETIVSQYFSVIPGPDLISATNTIANAVTISKAKPHLIDSITQEILKVKEASYKTEECKNIALGQSIETLSSFFEEISDKDPVVSLVRDQLNNTRPATAKKAEEFLSKHSITD